MHNDSIAEADEINAIDHSKAEKISQLINSRIENLRPKLLDLTRRNPLLSTKFSDRSNSIVRIVDSIPSILFESMRFGKVSIASLPPLDEELKDEATREFQSALAEARSNDEVYLRELDEISQASDDSSDLLATAERSLKDRLREKLGMPTRQTKNNPSLHQHALNHNIRPSWELPSENEQQEDGHHPGNKMQTLLLPDMLERRLNGLHAKDRSWKEETGINVLHAAFGFLEWQENGAAKSSYAPLILLPVELEKKRTRKGAEFWVTADEANYEINSVLMEKLRLDFSIVLPDYKEDQSIEEYLEQVAEQKPRDMPCWRVHRWAVIGVFPSARLAMYHDLDTSANRWDFAAHPVLSSLFGGNEASAEEMPFGDEYNIDEPHIESKVPLLVADADSSQVSAIVDIVDGKNLAVEGPPGTGKSQTIVNTIATALGSGKKVLFVAEKSAALEVVRSRLEAAGLGNFLLPLQATRSSKEQVISSIRDRIRMEVVDDPIELDELISQFRQTRDEVKSYIGILATSLGATDLNIHEILGQSIASKSLVDSLPESLRNYDIASPQNITKASRDELLSISEYIQNLWLETTKTLQWWKGVRVKNPDPFKIEETLNLAGKTAKACLHAAEARDILSKFNVPIETKTEAISELKSLIEALPKNISSAELGLAERLYFSNIVDHVIAFLKSAEQLRLNRKELESHLHDPLDKNATEALLEASVLMKKYSVPSLTKDEINKSRSQREQHIANLKAVINLFESLNKISNCFNHLAAKDITNLCHLVANLSREALLLRNENLTDPNIQAHIRKSQKRAALLCVHRDNLKESFLISAELNQEEINRTLLTLEQAGIFAIFSSQYHQAKKYYRKISINKKFNKKIAVEQLKKLDFWMAEAAEFLSDAKLSSLLDVRFEGLDTNFEPYLEVFKYFEDIDIQFPGVENIALRALLHLGERDILISIPKLDSDHPINLLPELTLEAGTIQLKSCEEELIALNLAIDHFQKITNYLLSPEEWSIEKLHQLSKDLGSFQNEWQVVSGNQQIKSLLGAAFNGPKTKKEDIETSLQLAINLASLNQTLGLALLSTIKSNQFKELSGILSSILIADGQANALIEELATSTNTSTNFWLESRSFKPLGEFLVNASRDKEGLTTYSRFFNATQEFSKKGYQSFIEEILSSYEEPCNIAEIFNALLVRALAKEIYSEYQNVLVQFDGARLSSLRKKIADLDRKIISLSRKRLQAKLYRNARPSAGIGRGRKSDFTEMALLNNEISKQQRFASLREITKRAGNALLAIKPCWMMSPLSVAQYIPQGSIDFDIVIVDEASQMNPEDAIGALVRAKQCMIVGDTNQLPPSSFFGKILEDEDADEDEVVTEESILEMANATFKPARRLRWHYRSLHSGLIAFSNRHIYENDLVVFPAAHEDHPDMGVFYKPIENGLYSKGVNPEEAKVMVDAILEFMLKHPDLSLGVVVLNIKQRDLLIEEMNYAFERSPWAIKYQVHWDSAREGLEKFFIKNLENVQGDERDVIFIGTVYGPEKPGAPVMQRFGPINGIAGKRRLNVLFSRAKKKIVTFSSMTPANIIAEENGNPGAYMLKRWLEYSATRKLEFGQVTHKEPDSDFESHVIQQLKSIGCEAIPQVGVIGYSIDIGVKHPDWPHGFIMGVECDGATYHSSKSARDRDRLRQEVLEKLGWHLYRIDLPPYFETNLK